MRSRVLAVVAIAAACFVASPSYGRTLDGALASTCPAAPRGVHYYAPGSGRTVALTFDDGPGRSTPQIMRVLANEHVEATFFNVGINEASTPGPVRAEHAAGFALGDHTWDHKDLRTLDPVAQAHEIDRERREQASITGAPACLLRPPYGTYNATTLKLAQQRGMRVWYWSVDTEDWKATGSDAAYWVHRIVKRAEAGATMRHPVILMHNVNGGNPATVDALPTIIRYYRSRGYSFVDLYGHTGKPAVSRVRPATGPLRGRSVVTVIGSDFLGVRSVHFGSVAGRSVTVESNRRLTVLSPAHLAGPVHITVTTTFGTSSARATDLFRYEVEPSS
jgi:peptidoglycan/xylan/chitin deacetylase (PgdA/CDA1 family)